MEPKSMNGGQSKRWRHFWGRFMGLGLLFIGVGFYFGWSLLYGTWTDVGLYSFVIVLVVFGLLELALVQIKIKEENSIQ